MTACQLCHAAGQVVGAPHMAGEEGHRELSCLVHRHHGGVGKLVLYKRCDSPDGDARRRDEHQGLTVSEPGLRPVPQCSAGGQPHLPCQPVRGPQPSTQLLRQALPQQAAPVGEGNQADHLEASRQP